MIRLVLVTGGKKIVLQNYNLPAADPAADPLFGGGGAALRRGCFSAET